MCIVCAFSYDVREACTRTGHSRVSNVISFIRLCAAVLDDARQGAEKEGGRRCVVTRRVTIVIAVGRRIHILARIHTPTTKESEKEPLSCDPSSSLFKKISGELIRKGCPPLRGED